jgi:hypothetical protein
VGSYDTYAAVLEYLKRQRIPASESATYKIDGSFDKKIIGSRLGDFCYRANVITPDEPLWGIIVPLAPPSHAVVQN